jgi:dUTPase
MLKVKKLTDLAILPTVAYPEGDTGYDIYSPRDVSVPARGKAIIPIDIAIEADDVWFGADVYGNNCGVNFKVSHIIKDRSSIATKTDLFTKGGVIDSSYRGEIMVTMYNLSDQGYTFKAGERVAQMVPILTLTQDIIEVEELSESNRGSKRHGSSGK